MCHCLWTAGTRGRGWLDDLMRTRMRTAVSQALMAERRRTIPDSVPKLRLHVRRGDPTQPTVLNPLSGDAFAGLEAARGEAGAASSSAAVQPLCRNLDTRRPWYQNQPGEGEGVVRMVFSDIGQVCLTDRCWRQDSCSSAAALPCAHARAC